MTKDEFFKTVERLQEMCYEKNMFERRIEELEEQIDEEYTDLCLCMDINVNNRKHDNLDEMLCEYCFNPEVELPFCFEDYDDNYVEIHDLSELYNYIEQETKE